MGCFNGILSTFKMPVILVDDTTRSSSQSQEDAVQPSPVMVTKLIKLMCSCMIIYKRQSVWEYLCGKTEY